MKRIAIFSDIHGNSTALQAVLSDIKANGEVDGYWLIGDYAALGYDPIGVLETIDSLPNATLVRGNTDRFLVDGMPLDEDDEEFKKNLEKEGMKYAVTVTRMYTAMAWAQGMAEASGWRDWLANLPLEVRKTLPDNTRVLLVHASPGTDGGSGLNPALNDAELEKLVDGCEADLVFCGHTHFPFHKKVGDVQIVNCGSVSNPLVDSLKASYLIMEYDEGGYDIVQHTVDYDHAAVIRELKRQNHPAQDYIAAYLLGKRKPYWVKA